MKRHFLIIALLLFSLQVIAQTGIGTTTPHASAKLDVTSTNKGFLPPRVALTGVYDVSTIPSPATGLLVYCTGTNGLASGYYFFNGTAWTTIATEGGSGSVAAEFGAQFLSSNVSITSGTPVDVISFTLPSAGTWEVITFLRAQGAAGYASEFAIYDASNNLVSNSEILPAYGEIASTGTGVVRITTNGSAVYKVRAWASNGAFNVTSDFNGRTGVTWKKISGNAPVTGQSVDYVSVSTIYQTAIGDNRDLIFTTNNGGNIPYNTSTGVFTLSANKTYLFQAQVRANTPSVNSSYIEYGFVDATSNTLLINGTETITSSTTATGGYGSNPVINFIYTPSTNQTIKLRTTVNSNGTQTIVSGTANITQIGSSAIINPWTLSGTNTFNTTGNVGIGTTSPSNTLHLENGNSFGTDPGLTTSPGLYIYNNNNASTSAHSTLALRTNGNGGGNPYLSFDINGIRGYSMGIDNVDGDKFKFHTNWSLNNSTTPALTITSDGRMGIGTTSPSAALHVASYVTQAVTDYGYLAPGGSVGRSIANQNINYSIQADQRIRTPEINTISDVRIKKDILKLNTNNTLSDLNKLRVVNYSYIDQLVNGNKSKTGFIAQEVEAINSKFVNHSTDFIPSIFELAKSSSLVNDLLLVSTDKPHGLDKGDLVKFFIEGKKEIVKKIDNVTDSNRFSVNGWDESISNLFIYGKKVNDFRAIDFDQITALSVAAIQELSKKIEQLEIENENLKKKLSTDIEARLLKLEAKLKQ